jgi:hypothetical protein
MKGLHHLKLNVISIAKYVAQGYDVLKNVGIERMRREDAIPKRSYYPDTSTEELESTKNPSRHSWQQVIEI